MIKALWQALISWKPTLPTISFIFAPTNTVVELLFAHSPTKTWKRRGKADHSPWLQHQAWNCTAWDHADTWMDRLRNCMPRGCKFPRGIMAPWESKLKHPSSCASTCIFLLHAGIVTLPTGRGKPAATEYYCWTVTGSVTVKNVSNPMFTLTYPVCGVTWRLSWRSQMHFTWKEWTVFKIQPNNGDEWDSSSSNVQWSCIWFARVPTVSMQLIDKVGIRAYVPDTGHVSEPLGKRLRSWDAPRKAAKAIVHKRLAPESS